MRIGLLSDTHSHLEPGLLDHFTRCDELWHAGDVGDPAVLDALEAFRPVRAVYGNIDDQNLRQRLPLNLDFEVGGLRVFMTHIGGYPGRYTARVRKLLTELRPDIYVCGHSHILKVMPDPKLNLLHLNPGACGQHGFHRVKTALRFRIDGGKVSEMEVIELGRRGNIPSALND